MKIEITVPLSLQIILSLAISRVWSFLHDNNSIINDHIAKCTTLLFPQPSCYVTSKHIAITSQ